MPKRPKGKIPYVCRESCNGSRAVSCLANRTCPKDSRCSGGWLSLCVCYRGPWGTAHAQFGSGHWPAPAAHGLHKLSNHPLQSLSPGLGAFLETGRLLCHVVQETHLSTKLTRLFVRKRINQPVRRHPRRRRAPTAKPRGREVLLDETNRQHLAPYLMVGWGIPECKLLGGRFRSGGGGPMA